MARPTELNLENRDGFRYSGKQMLVLSLNDIDGAPVLKIESEPHYAYSNLFYLHSRDIPSLNKEEVMNDFQFCVDNGFSIFGLLLIPRYEPPAALVSVQDQNGTPVLRFDSEEYVYKENRKFITQISLPPLDDIDQCFDNRRIRQAIGKVIIETLLFYEG